MTACRNCGAALQGEYCHACGQKATHTDVTVHELVHDGIHEFVHIDGKIVHTLKLLLFKPGELTAEFLRGRRIRYVTPLRLYLVCSLIFFALAAWSRSPFINIEMTKDDIKDAAEREATAKEAAERLLHLRDEMMHNTPRAMFVLMPVFGLFTWAAFRRAQPYYVPHLYYALHFHAFVFLMLALRVAGTFAGEPGKMIGGLFPLAIGPYHYIALRRVFGGSRWQVAWKGTAVALAYVALIMTIMVTLLFMALRGMRPAAR
jgi:hypothetical protein